MLNISITSSASCMKCLNALRPANSMLFVCALAIFVAVSACDAVDPQFLSTASDGASLTLVQYSLSDCHPSMSPEQCDEIIEAADYLRNHSNSTCRSLGDRALHNYQLGNYRFDSNTPHYGYTYTNTREVWYGSASFNSGELANTMAHEERHNQGYGESNATLWGNTCGIGYEGGGGGNN